MKKDKGLKDLIHLATLAEGELIYWDTNTGIKAPEFAVIVNGKVGKTSLEALKTFLKDKTFTEYKPNVWF